MNLLIIHPSNLCNFNCDYCFTKKWRDTVETMAEPFVTKEEYIKWLTKFCPPNEWLVEFTGSGEPATHPEFNGIIRELSDLGYRGIIRTNSSLEISLKTKIISRGKNKHTK